MALVDKKLLEHLLSLARLDVAESEKEKLRKDVGAILDHVALLNEADTANVEPMTGGTQLTSVFRKDEFDIEWKKKNISEVGRIIEAFPADEEGHLKTPPVF